MEGINIELLVARVKEKYPEAKARIIHDNRKQFISKDSNLWFLCWNFTKRQRESVIRRATAN